jgi:cysteinyl-tRNA synthetase
LDFYQEVNGVFGILQANSSGSSSLEKEVEELIAARENARKEKNWALADSIRDELKAKNIHLEDTPQGVRWKIMA